MRAEKSTRRNSRTGDVFSANNAQRLAERGNADASPLILNDPPYGTERCYNGLRLVLAPRAVFSMADAVAAAKSGQKMPDGYYNTERMLKGVLAGKGQILLCGTCMEARGISDTDIVAGARRSSMAELATTIISAEKVLVF